MGGGLLGPHRQGCQQAWRRPETGEANSTLVEGTEESGTIDGQP